MQLRLVNREQFEKLFENDVSRETTDIGLLKTCAYEVRKVPGKERVLDFVVSSAREDRDRDIIRVAGWNADEWLKNPVVLWAHDHRQPPIARGLNFRVSRGKVLSMAEFTPADLNPFGDMIYRMYERNFMSATSVGFRPMKFTRRQKGQDEPSEVETFEQPLGFEFHEHELLEWSAVPVGAQPDAIMRAHDAGIDTAPMREWCERFLDEDEMTAKGLTRDQVENAWKACNDAGLFVEILRPMERESGDDGGTIVPEPEASELHEFFDDGELRKFLSEEKPQKVQSVVFKKSKSPSSVNDGKGWTVATAKSWLKEHAPLHGNKVDENVDSIRFRQFNPEKCEGGFQTLTQNFPVGVSAVSCNVPERSVVSNDEGCTHDWQPITVKMPHSEVYVYISDKRWEACMLCNRTRTVEVKRAISFDEAHKGGTPKAPLDMEWSGPDEVSAADLKLLRSMAAWVDTDSDEVKSSYRFIHHRSDDEHTLVWEGVRAATQRLFKDGLSIPDGDRKGVYEHLAEHYKEFDKDVPEFKDVAALEFWDTLKDNDNDNNDDNDDVVELDFSDDNDGDEDEYLEVDVGDAAELRSEAAKVLDEELKKKLFNT